MKPNLKKCIVLCIYICNTFISLSALNNKTDSIFCELQDSYALQEKYIRWDLYKETINCYEHLPHLCIQVFLRAIQPKWNNPDSTLVFTELSELSKLQNCDSLAQNTPFSEKMMEAYPFVPYPPYKGVDFKKLLLKEYLTIQVGCILEGTRFTVKLNAALLTNDKHYLLKQSITYVFFCAYKAWGTNREKNLQSQKFKNEFQQNVDQLVEDDGILFSISDYHFDWQIGEIDILSPKKVKFEDATLTPQSIFNYWE